MFLGVFVAFYVAVALLVGLGFGVFLPRTYNQNEQGKARIVRAFGLVGFCALAYGLNLLVNLS